MLGHNWYVSVYLKVSSKYSTVLVQMTVETKDIDLAINYAVTK